VATVRAHPDTVLAATAAVLAVAVLAWVGVRLARRPRRPEAARRDGAPSRIRVAIRRSVVATRAVRGRQWATAAAFAAASWGFDALCLIASAQALRLPVGVATIALLYLGIQVVLQLPLTPGGFGVIESGLLAGLTRSGAASAPAAAAVLVYRVLSCWLVIPLGGAAALALRIHDRRPGARTTDARQPSTVVRP
jgi:uncharacterized protein (TIRG00374 family)